jgi:hypothetical protein
LFLPWFTSSAVNQKKFTTKDAKFTKFKNQEI